MATLADELLNDFEDSGDENEHDDLQNDDQEQSGAWRDASMDGLVTDANDDTMGDAEDDEEDEERQLRGDELEDEERQLRGDELEDEERQLRGDELEDEDSAKAKVEKMQLRSVNDVRSVAGLMKTMQPVLEKIAHYQSIPVDQRTTHIGSIEDNPEYKLLTESNSLSTQIDSEIILVHKFIRDHYSTRFPELETLVTNPVDYAKTVAVLKNGPLDNVKSLADSTNNLPKQTLRSILDGPSLMVVHLEGTTTRGVPMDEQELQATLRACQMTLELEKAKRTLTDYVQSRMNIFAPNLTALIGSLTAAQLLNFAGGVKGLAKTPDRNVPAMGSKKQKQAGLATNVGIRQQGYLYQSELIQEIPTDLKIQAMRIVSAKLVLAARVDSVHEAQDGSTGARLREDCLTRLDKLTEPAPNRGPRALPAPDDKPARKRGGRRARKAKEATAMTDLRKQQNRMAFGKEEREVGYGTGEGTKGLGMIGQENDGRIRATQIDRRTMARLSKKNPGWGGSGFASSLNTGMSSSLRGFGSGTGAGNATTLRAQGLRTSGFGGNPAAGTASSLVFTPAQGLELVDPKVQAEMKRKREAENAGYFSGGTFTQINPGKTDAGGFKVPGLPPSKKVNTGR